MVKVVINVCYGGFGLSEKALERLKILKNTNEIYDFLLDRSDSDLIKVVEELGLDANDYLSKLKIVEIPDNIKWTIDEYDGLESIRQVCTCHCSCGARTKPIHWT